MATIGTFTKTDNGFAGTIQTLGLKATKVTVSSVEKSADTAPDFRIKAGAVEIGAAWHRTSKGPASESHKPRFFKPANGHWSTCYNRPTNFRRRK